MNLAAEEAINRAKKIQLVILDVDGVLTNGGLLFNNDGQEYKTFNSLDGLGIRMLLSCDIQVAIITGRESKLVNHRMSELGVELVYQGYRDKRPAFEALLRDTQLSAEQIAYVGDDLPDLPIMTQVGLAIAVQNAQPFVKLNAHWVTDATGGTGAVREATDFILDAKNLLNDLQASYLQ
ncbi:MAG: 3-deoxy-D-manno-octulosonate 8-phosphate phosphatase (KDO 8-P phosphatase) [Gammaproteobacteria bacterium]|jgi:3-deoxy-D-manno-octulosonate 8-phosphate phosphatase (KDO 8-P phosphatase)